MTKKKVKEVEPKVEKSAKLEVYEMEYHTEATMKVLVEAPNKKAADAWASAYGDDYINEALEDGREWDEQEGEFQSVRKLKPSEIGDLSINVVVDEDGEPLGETDDDNDDADDDSDDAGEPDDDT